MAALSRKCSRLWQQKQGSALRVKGNAGNNPSFCFDRQSIKIEPNALGQQSPHNVEPNVMLSQMHLASNPLTQTPNSEEHV
eukprot:1155329-Pelagomonas_calceolata.AAC.2